VAKRFALHVPRLHTRRAWVEHQFGGVVAPTEVGEPAEPFFTPHLLRYFPEWFLTSPTFEILTGGDPNKVVGITLAWQRCRWDWHLVPALEGINPVRKPLLRRPIGLVTFLAGYVAAMTLGGLSLLPL
jgi:hypothetical protein